MEARASITQNEEKKREQSINLNRKISATVSLIDMIDILVIFLFFVKEYWHEFLEQTGRYFMFPIAAAGACFQAVLAWHLVNLEERTKSGSVVKALVETLTGAAIAIAVGGGLMGLFAEAATVIFAITFGLKTLFQAGSAFYNFGKSKSALNIKDQDRFRERGINFSIGTLVGSLSVTSIILVMLLQMHKFAIFGIASGALGAGFSAYHLGRGRANTSVENIGDEENLLKQEEEMAEVQDHELRNELKLAAKKEKGQEVALQPQPAPAPAKSPSQRIRDDLKLVGMQHSPAALYPLAAPNAPVVKQVTLSRDFETDRKISAHF